MATSFDGLGAGGRRFSHGWAERRNAPRAIACRLLVEIAVAQPFFADRSHGLADVDLYDVR
jgi:hypothetical protein